MMITTPEALAANDILANFLINDATKLADR